MGKFDDYEVEDSEDYRSSGDSLGIKEISLEQYRRCCIEGSKEMLRGGTSTKIIRGQSVTVDLPNQRDIFINAVKTLEVVLMPFFIAEKAKSEKQKNSFILKLYDDVESNIKDTRQKWKENEKHFIDNRKKENWSWDNLEQINDKYEREFVELYRQKMVTLAMMLDYKNYFDEGTYIG